MSSIFTMKSLRKECDHLCKLIAKEAGPAITADDIWEQYVEAYDKGTPVSELLGESPEPKTRLIEAIDALRGIEKAVILEHQEAQLA